MHAKENNNEEEEKVEAETDINHLSYGATQTHVQSAGQESKRSSQRSQDGELK